MTTAVGTISALMIKGLFKKLLPLYLYSSVPCQSQHKVAWQSYWAATSQNPSSKWVAALWTPSNGSASSTSNSSEDFLLTSSKKSSPLTSALRVIQSFLKGCFAMHGPLHQTFISNNFLKQLHLSLGS